MIRKRYTKSRICKVSSPNLSYSNQLGLFPPVDIKNQARSTDSFPSLELTPQISHNTVTASTLSLENSAFHEDLTKPQQNSMKPPNCNLQVGVYSSGLNFEDWQNSYSNKDEISTETEKKDEHIQNWRQLRKDCRKDSRMDSRKDSRRDSKIDSRRNSSEASTPHLYTDYKQRLHNILLLNVSSSSFSSSFDNENDEFRSISSGSIY